MTTIEIFKCSDEIKKIETNVLDFSSAIEDLGPGAYTVFLIYPGKRILRYQHHFDRLRASCSALGIKFIHTPQELKNKIKAVLSRIEINNPRVCLLLPKAKAETCYFIIEQFCSLPKENYHDGVHVEYMVLQRKDPSVKNSSFLSDRKKIRNLYPDAHEILMCDANGYILEGLSSNFYAVLDGEISTAEEGVLSGISRSILLSVAKKEFSVNYHPIHYSEIENISEAFLTSTSRGVLPIRQIGSLKVGTRFPGDVTKRLQALFNEQIEKELVSLD